jgi:hypothetical protein
VKAKGFGFRPLIDIEAIDAGGGRTLAAGLDHRPHPLDRTMENRLDPAIRQISDPSGQVQGLGLLNRPAAIPNPLNPTRYQDMLTVNHCCSCALMIKILIKKDHNKNI